MVELKQIVKLQLHKYPELIEDNDISPKVLEAIKYINHVSNFGSTKAEKETADFLISSILRLACYLVFTVSR